MSNFDKELDLVERQFEEGAEYVKTTLEVAKYMASLGYDTGHVLGTSQVCVSVPKSWNVGSDQ